MSQIKASRARPSRSASTRTTAHQSAPLPARQELERPAPDEYAAMIQAIRDEYEAIILDLLEELGRRPRKG